ncbi:hypothetical protein [Dyadobacter bucti]|uniref:hypothetical protein n=1 Tax=Dyadobacter bucti TaxID=2572203 RepID=UPI00110838DA|nr:hypothetical protein [Dyadobacter bucti]
MADSETVVQYNGARLTFDFDFDTAIEEEVLLYKNGVRTVTRNTRSADARTQFDTGINTTGESIYWKIYSQAKDGDWLASTIKELAAPSASQRRFGWDDIHGDQDFNDATCLVTFFSSVVDSGLTSDNLTDKQIFNIDIEEFNKNKDSGIH